jgi:His/Glu/Gln/Arg/opine family amino acid ABC transporter permease subunit
VVRQGRAAAAALRDALTPAVDFNFVLRNLPLLREGLEITVALAALSLVGAALGGLVVMAARRSRYRIPRAAALGYIEVMRNTPIMVQIFVLYFGLPSVGLYPDAFYSAVIALVMQNSAYVGEIYRAGIESVRRVQTEAALSLGMRPRPAMAYIVFPQAISRVLPALGNQAVAIVKETSIASTIAVAELTHTGKLLLDRSAAPYETFLAIGLLYLGLSAIVLGGMKLVALRWPVRA